jgi:hypothetical protein
VLWVFVVALGLDLALAALVFGLVAPGPRRAWQICAAAAELAAVAMTLLYFRPTLVRLFLAHGAGLSRAAVIATVNRWVMWSRVRIVISFVAWCAALRALTLASPRRRHFTSAVQDHLDV